MKDARILVVEDEQVIHEAIEAILDCTIVKGMTIAEGLQVKNLDDLDLVLVDKNLPDGSGLELVRALKKQEPDLEFLIMTGFPSIKSAIEAIEVGAFDYLPKPFDSDDLALKVGNAVNKTRLARRERALTLELIESEKRYRAIFTASSDAIIMTDAESKRICAANRAAQRLYGYDEPAIMALRGTDLVSERGEQVEYPVSGKTTVLRTDKRRDGTTVEVEASLGSASYAGKEVLVEVIRDVSERIRVEKEREQFEQRLRKSEKMETLGQLAAGIAHDYNNLLVVFMGAVSELRDWINEEEGTTREGAEFSLGELDLATQSAADLTKQLLGFSRRQAVYPELLDVASIMESVVRLLRRTLEKKVKIELDIAPDLPNVWMDRGQFEQVVTNLAINARDAMAKQGTLHLSVGRDDSSEDRCHLVLTVRDTGEGMEPELLEKIFEPFFTTKGPEEGTGLGLANVQNIVRSYGGTIQVSSVLGEGTTFEMRFPAGKRSKKDAVHSDNGETATRGRGERILLVEDHPGVRASIERLLVKAGYSITSAASGEDGIASISSPDAFDLLLVDLVLPEMQGDKVAETVRKEFGLRALCMSAFDVANAVHASKVENLPFIAKPFSGDRLLARLREVLEDPAAPKA
jgi:PAS domain S-box-containing protein